MEINQGIQGLRFLIIFGVFLKHLYDIIGFPYFVDFGARGVEFFFLLSGFLEGMIWYYKPNSSGTTIWKRCLTFYRKKLAKFYFLHILTFALSIPLIFSFSDKSIKELMISGGLNLLLFNSWFNISKWSFNGVSWFLSSLCFCYLLTPMLSHFFSKRCLLSLSCIAVFFSTKLILDTIHYGYFFPPYRFIEFSIAFISGNLFLTTNIYEKIKSTRKLYGDVNQLIWLFLCISSVIVGDKKWIPAIFMVPFTLFLISLFMDGCIKDFLSNYYLVTLGNLGLPFFLCHYLVIQYVNWLVDALFNIQAPHRIIVVSLISLIIALIFSVLLSKLNNYAYSFIRRIS